MSRTSATGLHLGTTPWRGLDPERFADQARRAEELGYRSIWLPESHFLEHGAAPAPLLLLAAAAAVTDRLQLGTVSLLLPIRDPILLAEEVAVLDRLSGGRVILGLGRGFRSSLFAAFGVDPKDKRRRFRSHLRRMIELWSGDATPRLAPAVVQRPHPALWVAAFGPKALEQAASLGLPYLASPMEPLATLVENYRLHRRLLAGPGGQRVAPVAGAGDASAGAAPGASIDAASEPTPLAVPVMRTVFVSEDGAQREEARSRLAEEGRRLARSRAGRLRSVAESPVDERALIGDLEQVRSGIARYRQELGMTHLIARAPLGLDSRVVECSLDLLSQAVDG